MGRRTERTPTWGWTLKPLPNGKPLNEATVRHLLRTLEESFPQLPKMDVCPGKGSLANHTLLILRGSQCTIGEINAITGKIHEIAQTVP